MNAKNHEREADIIANAGKKFSVIITTSISGRGVDIKLGGKSNEIKDKSEIKSLSQLLLGVSDELILHETYAKEWEIDLSTNYIRPATKNYTDFLYDVSSKLSSVEIMFAMTPCMRLYSWIGKNLSDMIINNPYKEWILTYSDESFDNLAKSLEKIIDNYQEQYDINQAQNLYKKAMELELDFFNDYSNF